MEGAQLQLLPVSMEQQVRSNLAVNSASLAKPLLPFQRMVAVFYL